MSPTRSAKERFEESVMRALNKIKRPSSAEEITSVLNGELGPGDPPFSRQEVEAWLRSSDHAVLALYWLRNRPRR